MRRRDLIKGIAGSAKALPLMARDMRNRLAFATGDRADSQAGPLYVTA